MHILEDGMIKHTLEHMIRHGFDVTIIDELDPFQINQLLWHCSDIFKNTQYPDNYPASNIHGSFTDMGRTFVIPKEQLKAARFAVQTKPSKLLEKHRLRRVDGAVGKHLLKKKQQKRGRIIRRRTHQQHGNPCHLLGICSLLSCLL